MNPDTGRTFASLAEAQEAEPGVQHVEITGPAAAVAKVRDIVSLRSAIEREEAAQRERELARVDLTKRTDMPLADLLHDLSVDIWTDVTDVRVAAHEESPNDSPETMLDGDRRWPIFLGEQFGKVFEALADESVGIRQELVTLAALTVAWLAAIEDADERLTREREG